MDSIKSHKSSNVQRFLIIITAGMIALIATVGYQIFTERKNAERYAEQQAAQLVDVVADQVELSFLSVDLSLRRAVERQYFNTLFGGNLAQYMGQNFSMWLNETPQIVALMLVNQKGAVEVAVHKKNYERWFDYNKSLSGEVMFETMRDASDRIFFIGRHTMQDKKTDLIVMSRKVNNIDGSFGGIVVAAIDPEYFNHFFASVDRGQYSGMAMALSSDKTVLVSRENDERETPALIDRAFARIGGDKMAYDPETSMETIADRLKVYSYRTLRNMPITLVVSLDERDFLEGWTRLLTTDAMLLGTFIVFGSIVSLFILVMGREWKLKEESEAAAILASQAKSEFLANMSHELRTPLNAIIGFSEMMSAGYFGPLNAKQKERVHDINLCGAHLLQLISDILEFSKGEAGKLELVEEKTSLGDIIHECERIMHDRIKHKNINLLIDVQEAMPLLWADKRKLRQMLLNLMSNAVKFTPEAGTIKVTGKIDQVGNMNLIVADTGIGIAEEDIPTALSVFGQVHRSQSHEGTGLGLPLCKMFAELHGGKLAIASTLGEGTTVRIIFPAQRVIPAEE